VVPKIIKAMLKGYQLALLAGIIVGIVGVAWGVVVQDGYVIAGGIAIALGFALAMTSSLPNAMKP
jgi:hypothetical protein